MSDPKPFDPFDPVGAAMAAMHQANLLAADKAKIDSLTYAGNELARVMEDILCSGMVNCQISRAVITSTIAKWKEARFGR